MGRLVAAIIALVIVAIAYPETDCTGLSESACERLELINAGAID